MSSEMVCLKPLNLGLIHDATLDEQSTVFPLGLRGWEGGDTGLELLGAISEVA